MNKTKIDFQYKTPKFKKYRVLYFVLLVMLLSACGAGGKAPQSPLLASLEKKTGLIAYIGVDRNVYLVNQAGGDLLPITTNALIGDASDENRVDYRHLTWAKNGENIAFVGVAYKEGFPTITVQSAAVIDGKVSTAFRSQTETPIYLYWSPDSQRISYIASSEMSNGFTFQSVPLVGGDRIVLDAGVPYFWDWAPTSDSIIVHTGRLQINSYTEHLSLLSLKGNRISETVLPHIPVGFPAPDWSQNGENILIVANTPENIGQLLLLDHEGNKVKTIMEFEDGLVYFGFSPDGSKVAVINGNPDSSRVLLGKLQVIDLATLEVLIETEEDNVTAFFWSPDGERIAYFNYGITTVPGANGSANEIQIVSINGVDLAKRETYEILGYFQPTEEFASMLQFFDQYQHSDTIWSPDSRNLVLSVQPLTTQTPEIWILEASGNLQPRKIADGYFAVWSWK